jgi:hypothetical protein
LRRAGELAFLAGLRDFAARVARRRVPLAMLILPDPFCRNGILADETC